MTSSLTYPPEIVIESKIDLPPEIRLYPGCFGQGSNEVGIELAWLLIEFVIELLGRIASRPFDSAAVNQRPTNL